MAHANIELSNCVLPNNILYFHHINYFHVPHCHLVNGTRKTGSYNYKDFVVMSVTGQPAFQSQGNPLPPGWTQHRAPTGQPYWYHSYTGMSSWTPPYHNPSGPPGSTLDSQPFRSQTKPQIVEKEKPVERYLHNHKL
jgi:hypothetical protein